MAGSGPGGSTGSGHFGSAQWSDNVGRMHLFMQDHPEVKITVPRENGTADFIATWEGGEAKDRSLGWLMDRLTERFDGSLS